ncbi:MAG: ribonuclease III [Anaerolineae bacterium]|nr:ribonuclease III [Anaerolineae bacterium]
MDISAAENALSLAFQDKTLLQRALTHRSYLNENPDYPLEDNERLEFLGDAVLDFAVGQYLYERFPEENEGFLTSLRAALVCTRSLSEFATQIGLGNHLLLGRGEDEGGGRERPAVLCGAFEALVGALYLDRGMEDVTDFILPIFEPALDNVLRNNLDKDAKSVLQELSQAYLGYTPRYHTVGTRGPDHDRIFTVAVTINGVTYGKGEGRSKQASAQAAAAEAIEHLDAMLHAPVIHVPEGADFEMPSPEDFAEGAAGV